MQSKNRCVGMRMMVMPGDDDGASGGGMYGMHGGGGMRFGKHSNAYMLVYVRVDDWERVMCAASDNDLSAPLKSRVRFFPCW
jgi:hypothetical protein